MSKTSVLVSVAVIKHSDQNLGEERIYFSFHFQVTVYLSLREVKAGTGRQAFLLIHTASWPKELPSQRKHTGTLCTLLFARWLVGCYTHLAFLHSWGPPV